LGATGSPSPPAEPGSAADLLFDFVVFFFAAGFLTGSFWRDSVSAYGCDTGTTVWGSSSSTASGASTLT
jgi:hypothetical protein